MSLEKSSAKMENQTPNCREEWGCTDEQLLYLNEGIKSWLETHIHDDHHDSIDRIEVLPLCTDNPNTFSRMYEIDGKNVIRLYMYNILRAATKYKVYVKLLTMFLIEHEVTHLVYNSQVGRMEDTRGNLPGAYQSEEKLCDEAALAYMAMFYPPRPLDGIRKMLTGRRAIYKKQRDDYRIKRDLRKDPRELF